MFLQVLPLRSKTRDGDDRLWILDMDVDAEASGQGDQIGWIIAFWAIANFEQFYKI
jgi:hypothetical protein